MTNYTMIVLDTAIISVILSLLDYLHTVIHEVSEAEEKEQSADEVTHPVGSTEDLEEGITFTARKQSSKFNQSKFNNFT